MVRGKVINRWRDLADCEMPDKVSQWDYIAPEIYCLIKSLELTLSIVIVPNFSSTL